jgi:hypothetical protein
MTNNDNRDVFLQTFLEIAVLSIEAAIFHPQETGFKKLFQKN